MRTQGRARHPRRRSVCESQPRSTGQAAREVSEHDGPRNPGLWLVVVLGGLVALGPLTTALYLPALPSVVEDLDTSATAIQLTLTGTLLGLVVGQLLVGPLSDAVGRRLPLLIGATVHVLASVGCAVAPTVAVLVAARVMQGLGAAAGVVLALAIIRDLFTGRRAAALLSRLLLILGAATILAPPAGAALLSWTQWRGVFAALAGVGILVTALAAWRLAETLPRRHRRPLALRAVLQTYAGLLRAPAFVGMIVVVGLTMAALYAYLAAAPFVFQERFGVDPQQLGLLLGAGSVLFVGATQLNPLLLDRHEPQHILIAAA
ncbi:MAG: Bcr/CflA family efflux MFS transporter, partial [Pseudonocardia sp.]